jgi:hypothetical protein
MVFYYSLNVQPIKVLRSKRKEQVMAQIIIINMRIKKEKSKCQLILQNRQALIIPPQNQIDHYNG